ncbi:ATP-binding protein [Streptomyces turgidiscabies]|uniref:ATPase, AAA family n=1 Tax=Streptomyces turgidiscabies (strain Car8) TaxID=698760 RepID=L7F9X9_STRT8|nr:MULTISPECIES: ATP-binding protein [Streptomyces]ELP67861.1 ATPase, AAA family [Streptomyces turgidiscabies Car8]MDX3493684.1 ATP-binding protein [Streptomyces turgidiscabies]GAQ71722.1 ATP-dependent zinc metalloprotease FtsH [Streptomyces turgidiscabies]
MNATGPATLTAEIRRVLARVDAHAAHAGEGTGPVEVPRPDSTPVAAGPVTAPLDALVTCFGLTPFERDLVLLTAAQELEPTAAARCAAACGDRERTYPTFSLALAALAEPHWSALTPVAPLRRWRITELDDESRLTTSRLRLDERILHFLLGSPYLDARLHGQLRRASVPDRLPPSYDLAASRVAAGWATGASPDAPLLVEVTGGDLRSRADIGAAAAARAGLGLYSLSAEDIPGDPAERDRFARLWQREAILLPAALLVDVGELDRDQRTATEAFLAGAAVPVVVSSEDPLRTDRPHGTRVTVPRLDEEEQLALWADAFDDVADLAEGELRSLVAQFQLPPHVVRAAASAVRRDLPGEDDLDAAELAWRAGLDEARVGMDELGRRIEPEAAWGDLVLHERQTSVLREIVAHVRRRPTVHQEWGFAATLRRGLGVTALFAGGSGTGKTLAAEVMAKELGLDLFVVDLSQVVSKYIGETEKNLRRVFDAAERGGALLLFDEADALFGKRSEVKDSHDRYANLEVSYLLMRMEAYRGLAILTTNMKKALDTAFLRRIRFVVDFPFPAEHERAEIWRRVLPPQAPVKDIDSALLAQLTVAGGSIRNIALSGAFLAAEEGDRLQMRHMLAAARTEYLKLERSLTPTEVRGWV